MSAIEIEPRHAPVRRRWFASCRTAPLLRLARLPALGCAVAAVSLVVSVSALAAGEHTDCAASAGSFDEKIAACSAVIADEAQSAPHRADAYTSRGVVYFKRGDFNRAIPDFGEAIKLAPEDASAYEDRGNAYYSQRDYDRALADFSEAIKRNPQLASPYARRGLTYRAKGDYSRSIADLSEAIARDAGYVFAYERRCDAYYSKQNLDAAISDCDQAIRLDPSSGFAYTVRALARANKRDYEGAIADSNEAIRVDPNSGAGYNSRGVTNRLKGDYAAAIADFSEAIRLTPRFAAAFANRGVTWRERGDDAQALSDFTRAIEINPRYFQAYNLRGRILASRGENISAVADFNNAIRLNPGFVAAYDNRGIAYVALSRTQDAIADFQKAQSIDPSDRVSRERLASLGPMATAAPRGAAAPPSAADPAVLGAVMSRLSIDLPIGVAGVDPVRKPLEDLGREPCDQQAISALGQALERVGRKREAAAAQLKFSGACGGHAPSLKAAATIYLALSDYASTVRTASDLIKLDSHDDAAFYLRATAYDRDGNSKKAIDDYLASIELFPNKANLSSDGYLAIARNYEKLGQLCDAELAVESWVALNPERNDSTRMQAIIADYNTRGKCDAVNARSEEIIKIPPRKNVVRVPVLVNGVRGTFILDTGASFVTMSQGFAQKAKIQADQGDAVRMRTANGVVEGKRERAATVQLRSLLAKDVSIVVQTSGQTTYGDGVDGLLGMSFLSRFKVSIDTESIKISSRTSK